MCDNHAKRHAAGSPYLRGMAVRMLSRMVSKVAALSSDLMVELFYELFYFMLLTTVGTEKQSVDSLD